MTPRAAVRRRDGARARMPDPRALPPDTGYYVYGVVPAVERERPALAGIDARAVEYVEHGDVVAAVSVFVLDRPPGRRAELLAHSAVLEALAADGPVVPVQFGSVLADRDAVVSDLLEPDRETFARLLERLRGTRQYNLRATYVEDQVLAEIVRTRPDIAELRRRTRTLPEGMVHPDLVRLGELVSQAMEGKRQDDADQVLEVLLPHVVAESPRAGGGVDHLLEVAVLVDEQRVPEMEAALETLAEALHERVRLRLTGPVPPYDFVEEERWA
jgi:Gas vesicle synthesis protein GvpL/GvpF